MNLGLKQKFTMLAILSGIVASIIAGVGYYVSYQNLSATIEGEMNTVIGAFLPSTLPISSAVSATLTR